MKTGWLIYDEEGAERNEWFIAECLRAAKAEGLQLRLYIYDGSLPEKPYPDFALVRVIAPKLSAHLAGAGTRLFNNFAVSAVANDKWLTYQAAAGMGIPVMPTEHAPLAMKNSPFGYPVVVKSRDGHGGAQVHKLSTKKEYVTFVHRQDPAGYIVQKFCSEAGTDMRVYLLGGQILAGVLRTSNTDFRSNFSLGGKVERVGVPEEIVSLVEALQEKFAFDFVGVDFIRDGGRWVLNEIEDVVGSRMLYKTTDLDVASLYIRHVAKSVKAAQG